MKQAAGVPVLQAAEQITEVPKIPDPDDTAPQTVEQGPNVPVSQNLEMPVPSKP